MAETVQVLKVNPGKQMKVKTIAHTRVRGQHFAENKIVELPEPEAWELIAAGKAEKYVVAAKEEKSSGESAK